MAAKGLLLPQGQDETPEVIGGDLLNRRVAAQELPEMAHGAVQPGEGLGGFPLSLGAQVISCQSIGKGSHVLCSGR